MSVLGKSLKGSVELSMGQILTYGCSFLRLAILARLLTTQDFGIAATFSMTIFLLEKSSNMSLKTILIQDKNGDSESFQGTAHFLTAIRGIILALFLFLLAWPVTHFFKIPEARWAFHCLAMVPLLRGFMHLDVERFVRKMHFRPRIATEVLPQVAITAAAWPMAIWLGDYSALLWLLVAKAVFTLIASHLLATRTYRWAWHKAELIKIFHFAWPLLLNGPLVFLVAEGDRFITGAFYTMSSLGLYAAAAGLVAAASGAIIRVTNSIFLPSLSQVQDDSELFLQRYQGIVRTLVIIAAIFSPPFILLGDSAAVLVYGEKYRAAGILVAWLGAAQALAMIRNGPILAAIAMGDTKCVPMQSVIRATGVGCAFVFAYRGMPLHWIAASAVLGECLALAALLQLVSYRLNLKASTVYGPATLVGAGVAMSIVFTQWGAESNTLISSIIVLLGWAVVCLFVARRWYPEIFAQFALTRARFVRRLSSAPK